MLINLEELMKKESNILDLNFSRKIDIINYCDKELKIVKPVEIVGKIINTEQGMYLECNIDISVVEPCGRCLKDVVMDINYDIKGFLVKEENYVLEEDDTFVYDGKELDFKKVLEDTLILNIPQSILCSEDCKGLCHKCGCDLNEKKCNCDEKIQEQLIDPRFAKLKELFKND